MRNWKGILLWTASALLAALFLAAGLGKFASAGVLAAFAQWGYPIWFARLIGMVEISAGLLLLWRRTAWRAASVLAVVMAGAVATHLYAGELALSLLPATLLVTLVLVGYCRHPRATLKARLQAAVDWVAERELAQEERYRRTPSPRAPKFLVRPSASPMQPRGVRSQTLPH
jgi:putative oxidoreductase